MKIWRLTVLLISLSYQGKSDKVRCYCNLEECLPGGSVCSSEDGRCFYNFHITSYRGIKQVERGCLSLLKKERQLCQNASGLPSWSSTSFLLCCQSDMCNQYLGPISNLTHSLIGSLINTTEEQKNLIEGFGRPGTHGHRHPHEIWFKAATIVVPICGAMILFFLIALAFKILRADHANMGGKYCKKASKSNANYLDSHVIDFKPGELNSEDFSKKMPLLYETRQSENFRNFTTARIHFGQNVNILKEAEDANKIEKNLENEKINLEKPWFRQHQQSREIVVATTSRNNLDVANDNNNNESNQYNGGVCHGSNNNNNSHNGGSPSSYSEVSAASAENSANSVLDVRVSSVVPEKLSNLPALNLNLDKTENLNSFNIYRSPKTTCRGDQTSCCAKVHEKVYDKRFL